MKVRKIKQAKRRIAIRLILILVGVFLAGAASGAGACVLMAVNGGLI